MTEEVKMMSETDAEPVDAEDLESVSGGWKRPIRRRKRKKKENQDGAASGESESDDYEEEE